MSTKPKTPKTTKRNAGAHSLHRLVRRFAKLIYVEWIDSGGRSGWHEPEIGVKAMECVSVGWLSDETDDAVTITGHIQIKPRFHHDDMTIPKCAITRMETLIA